MPAKKIVQKKLQQSSVSKQHAPRILLSQNTLFCSYLSFGTILFALCIFFVLLFLLAFYPPMMMEFGGEWFWLQLIGILVALLISCFFLWTLYLQSQIIVALFQNKEVERNMWKGILFILIALFVFLFFFHAFWSSLQFLRDPYFDLSHYFYDSTSLREMYQQSIFFVMLWFSGWTTYAIGALYFFGILRSYPR